MSHAAWFSARLLFASEHPDETDVQPVFEDRIVLLEAEDEDEALGQAKTLGHDSCDQYTNESGARVIWRFVEVLDLVQLPASKLGVGTQVYFQYLDEKDLAAVRRSLEPGKFGDE